ncbi:hypothetical protein HY950_04060 [Candidatus Gottesmanbacteria bacterium]|nr:hypothetical protein [Candidatus Gottesmanbacteria bacterium]
MHDDTQVARVIVMGKALRNGQFPVRLVSDLGYGYGYPLFNFYGPLPYYVGGFLYMWGIPALLAAKIMFFIGTALAGITMYVLASEILGAAAGVVSAVAFVYAPYHAVQIYVRGAVGEFWAMAFLPLVVWGLMTMKDSFRRRSAVFWGGIGLAGVILSHTIFGYLTAGTVIGGIVLYWIISRIKKTVDRNVIIGVWKMVGIGLGISTFFWLPAFAEMGWTSVSAQIGPTANFRDHFVCLWQLWNAQWGFGGSISGCVDGMSFKLGKLHVFLALTGLLAWWIKRNAVPKKTHYILLALGITLGAVFIMLPSSQFLWDIVPFSSYVQYPWRFLTYAVLGLSMLGGLAVTMTDKRALQWLLAVVIVIAIVAVNAKWFRGQYRVDRPAGAYEDSGELRFRVSKISDEYLPASLPRPNVLSEVVSDSVPATVDYTVETEVDTETYFRFVVTSRKDAEVTIRRAYFPGWNFWVNGKVTNPSIVDGVPHIPVSTGESIIEMHFFSTPVRVIGNLISVMTLMITLFFYGKKQTKTLA